jgi:hypothetical protein
MTVAILGVTRMTGTYLHDHHGRHDLHGHHHDRLRNEQEKIQRAG